MVSFRGSTNNVVADIESAKRVIEFSAVGHNDLWKKSEHMEEAPITWTRFENGEVKEIMLVSPSTWRLMRQ